MSKMTQLKQQFRQLHAQSVKEYHGGLHRLARRAGMMQERAAHLTGEFVTAETSHNSGADGVLR